MSVPVPPEQVADVSAPLVLATDGADASRAVARRLAAHLRPGDLLVLDGPLGAGKTTFTQGLGEALGVRGSVASPTFVISRVHPSLVGGPALVHVDAYRLSGGFEIEDLDLDADADDAVTVVEWGRDRVEGLSDSHLLLELARPDADDPALDGGDGVDEPRTLSISAHGPRWDAASVAALRADLLGDSDATSPDATTADRSPVDGSTADPGAPDLSKDS